MLRSYIIIAWRNIIRSKAYSIINMSGLTLGVACCLLLALYIQDEMSYDQHHARLDDLYRVTTKFEGGVYNTFGVTSPPIANALINEIPEVEFAARMVVPPGTSQNLIRYKDELFYEAEGAIADATLFDVLTYEFIEGNSTRALTHPHAVVITDRPLIAVFISCLGLYGLSTFMAERRSKEIGIRKVLGASVSQITRLMSGEFVRLVLIAAIIAIPFAWYAMDKWLANFAYRISVDVFVFVYAASGALIIALVTVSFESIRAASANPVKSLRNE